MPSLYFNNTMQKWQVRELIDRIDGRYKTRTTSFFSREEAEAFVGNLPPSPRRRRVGNGRRRTASQVLAFIADNSALDDDGCMVWQNTLTIAGYGRLTWKPVDQPLISGAHRLIYHLTVQPVEADKVIDHLCRNRACVRPDHLEMVQQRENVMRSPIAPGAVNAAKTHCPQGHEYSPENTYVYTFKTKRTTTRICRACARAHHARYDARKRAQREAVSA